MRLLFAYLIIITFLASCRSIRLPVAERKSFVTGSSFYQQAAAFNWKQRDSFVVSEVLSGNIPSFLLQLVPVTITFFDSASGSEHRAILYVTPDYLSVGTEHDWARVNITPMAAQRIADSFHCFLPTRKIVDAIYKAAAVQLPPVPMYAFRDSTPTMYHHHLIIEGQRKGRKGLIAGIRKDVVITGQLLQQAKQNRVAIYGWHQPNGKVIQPLYTGHVNWWVDYSQGIRLVYQQVRVNGKWMHYKDVLKDPVLQKLLCDEAICDFYTYPY
jgi:hypothetical protein